MLEDNKSFSEELPPGQLDSIQYEQNPYITVLTCCDSRVRIRAFLADPHPTDNVFVIRNVGNQLAVTSGSVDYGVRHLKTPLLLILGHTRCGAIKAASTDYRKLSLHLVQELNGLHIPVRGMDPGTDDDVQWLQAVERNVHYQMDLAVQRYAPEIAEGTLAVIGCVYDFANLYKKGIGKTVLLNVNGESNSDVFTKSDLMDDLPADLVDSVLPGSPVPQ